MFNRYVSTIATRLRLSGDIRRAVRWANHAFADFVVPDGGRPAMLSTMAAQASRLTRLARDLDRDANTRSEFAKALLGVCQSVDTGRVRLETSTLRSYQDISIQIATLRRLVDYLSAEVAFPGGAPALAAWLVEQAPDSRPALLVRADLLMEQSQLDDAIELIRCALRIQAVCPSAQQLLSRALQTRRKVQGDAGDLDGSNYDLSDKFCHMPFTHLSTGFKGEAFTCCCPAWVPFPVGNVFTAESAEAVWNSPAAAEIRRSIHDGDFRYCSRTLCSYIAGHKLPRRSAIVDPTLKGYIDERKVVIDDVPQMVELNHDPTCNLACPSCRTEIVGANLEERDSYALAAERVILPLLKTVHGQTYISGGGEAFASQHFRSILSGLNRDEYPGLYVYLITNGLLVTPQKWTEFPHLPEMIDILSVSIDAARPETYERLRRPGKWPVLMRNLEHMAEMHRAGTIRRLQINFVVQEENYREILEFAELGARLGVDQIWFQRLTNYGAYDERAFMQADVTSPAHPAHAELLEILRSPVLAHRRMNLEMLMPILPEVVAAELRLPIVYESSRRTPDIAAREDSLQD